MSLELEISARARRDLRAIVLFIAKRNRDLTVAERFGQRLLDRYANLINAPKMGSPYLERTGVRKINEGAYKILYRVTDKKVIVMRIWDGRRGRDPKI
jgi:plasmid stabilization system protein ParE